MRAGKVADGSNFVLRRPDSLGIDDVASKLHRLANLQFAFAECDAMRAASEEDGTNTADEFFLCGSGDEDVIDKFDDAFQPCQGFVGPLAEPVTRGAQAHGCHRVDISSPW